MPKKNSTVLAVLALGFVFCAPIARADEAASSANAQAALQSVLTDQKYPLSVQIQNLDSTWRRIVVNKGSSNAMEMQVQMWGAMTGLEFDVHFTKGEIAKIGENSYLIAYQLPVNIDSRFINWHGHGQAPKQRKPDGETVLNLSLLNLKSIDSLNNVRPFDPKTDMIDEKQSRADSVQTLKDLGQGVLRYIRARGTLPALNNPTDFNTTRVFYPYVGDERLFMHPGTQEMYLYNTILGNKKVAHIPNKQSFVVFYEAEPSSDNTRAALFLDGHVERLSPTHWQTVSRASKITDEDNG